MEPADGATQEGRGPGRRGARWDQQVFAVDERPRPNAWQELDRQAAGAPVGGSMGGGNGTCCSGGGGTSAEAGGCARAALLPTWAANTLANTKAHNRPIPCPPTGYPTRTASITVGRRFGNGESGEFLVRFDVDQVRAEGVRLAYSGPKAATTPHAYLP